MGKRFLATLRGIFDTATPILIPRKTTASQHLLKSPIEIQNHFINKMSSIDSLKRKKDTSKKVYITSLVQKEYPQDHCHGHGACSSGARGGHSRLGQRLSRGHVLGLGCLGCRGLGLREAVVLEVFEAGPVVVLVVPQPQGMPQKV